jgi:antitoxin (DNA-binding transcriptional repressor) of toxin-antitoxin stability system
MQFIETRPDQTAPILSMTIRNVTETKAELSALLVLVESGEEIVIARAGKPIAKIIKLESHSEPRKLGLLKEQIVFSPDYDQADAEIERLFYGEVS